MTDPDVTVVVICFDDAARLPRAVASVQRQTLRNLEIVIVDDASTDGTEHVARQIASADPRVRYERLAANSGGCSAPRNRGLDLARAPWVMFCDSDDEYERHACKNLLTAAERTGADVVCGTAERVDVRTGRTRRWRPDLHDEERVLDALVDLPELLYDTISVNKIYRVDLLRQNEIRFPEGILYEDQLFTLQAMASAHRLAVIPETVYRWHVDRLGEDLSITQRRGELRNVDSRIAVNRMIDAYLDTRGLVELRAVKDEKFLRHDLYLYLSSIVEADDETAAAIVDRLAAYVDQVPLAAAWRLRPALRVAIFHLLLRDVDGIRSAMRFVTWASAVDATIDAVDGRDRWTSAHPAAGLVGGHPAAGLVGGHPAAGLVGGHPAAEWLDVTDLGLRRIPFGQRRFLHRVDAIEVTDAGGLRVHGRTRDYDGTLAASDRVELRFALPGGRTAMSAAGEWVDAPAGRPGWATWRVDGALRSGVVTPLETSDHGTLSIAVCRDGVECVVAVRSERRTCPEVIIGFVGPIGRAGPDAVRLGAGEYGAVTWQATTVGPARIRRARRRRAGWSGRLRRAWLGARDDVLRPVVNRIGRRLPRRDLALFDAPTSRAFAGDLAAIDAALAAAYPGVDRIWANRSAPESAPAGSGVVIRGSMRHSWLLGRARWVVGDDPVGTGADQPSVTVQVAADVPVLRVGLDDPAVLVRRADVARLRRAGRRRRLLLAPSAAVADRLAAAVDHRGDIVATGAPRLDRVVVTHADPAGARRAMDLPTDRAVVVCAPAARRGGVEAAFDAEDWAQRFGDRTYLVLAQPPGEPIPVPTRLRWAIRDLSAAQPIHPFLAAADLAVADYSGLVADAAALDVPVVLFWPDAAAVERAHGVYPEVVDVGPVVGDWAELTAAVAAWLDDPRAWDARYADRRRTWARRWCGPIDAGSADRAAAAIVGSGQ